jgi:hypothetical protein
MIPPAITVLIEMVEKDLQECWSAIDAEHFTEAIAALDRAKVKIQQISDLRKPASTTPPNRQLTIELKP